MKLLLVIFLLTFCSCYQNAAEDDLHTVSVTNNPHVIQDSHRSTIPGAHF